MSSTGLVYEGVWVQWDKGSVYGWTLTLNTRDAALLQAFLSFYVTIAGGFLWQFVAYAIHQIKAGRIRDRKNGSWNSTMVILRNSASPVGLLWEMSRASLAWRHTPSSVVSGLLLAMLALVVTALVTAASIMTSRVTISDGATGLIKPNTCGVLQFPAASIYSEQKILSNTVTAAAYARDCYYGSLDATYCSHQYYNPALKWQTDSNAPCPFNVSLCIGQSFSLDTGLLDSRVDLGLNTLGSAPSILPEDDNLLSNPHTWVFGTAEGILDVASANQEVLQNFTWQYNENAIYDQSGYSVFTMYYLPGTDNLWHPIPELSRSDADVSIFFLAQGFMHYAEACEDPWFKADLPVQGDFESNDWATAMACVDQHQICLQPDGSQCSPMQGSSQTLNWWSYSPYNISGIQIAVFERLATAISLSTIQQSVLGRGYEALRASETALYQSGTWEQPSLPSNQWTIEVSGWFAVQMANLQRNVVEWVTAPTKSYIGGYTAPPFSDDSRILCYEQMIPLPSGYQNFSFLGVIIIGVLGTLTIVIGATLSTIVVAIQRRWWPNSYSWQAWTLDEKLQLQRLAQQSVGWGSSWRGELDSVPTTADDEELGRYLVKLDTSKEKRHIARIEIFENEEQDEYEE